MSLWRHSLRSQRRTDHDVQLSLPRLPTPPPAAHLLQLSMSQQKHSKSRRDRRATIPRRATWAATTSADFVRNAVHDSSAEPAKQAKASPLPVSTTRACSSRRYTFGLRMHNHGIRWTRSCQNSKSIRREKVDCQRFNSLAVRSHIHLSDFR